jgi:predicted nucleic acid-binding protein
LKFADLAAGDSVFLDANPLVYHFAPDPIFGLACNQLMSRVENQEIVALTSTHVLSDVAHHLMMLEASALFGWPSKVVQRLKQQPTAIQKLGNFRRAILEVAQSAIRVVAISPALLATAAAISQQFGLLSNDALIIAVMQANGHLPATTRTSTASRESLGMRLSDIFVASHEFRSD